ncbi:hypothetical protein AGMMS50249_2850 [candidate division SR1 bacterium]|nr:hypothetical protein AGMMS50249_2850 [candidate division SR1 bacterium]
MTKSTFLLGCGIFIILGAILLGLLTGNTIFFKVGGGIEIAFFLLMLVGYNVSSPKASASAPKIAKPIQSTNTSASSISAPSDQATPSRPASGAVYEHKTYHEQREEIVRPTTTKRVKIRKTGQWVVLIISLIVALILMFIVGEIITFWSPLVSGIIGFLLYVVIGKILDIRGFSSVKKLGSARIYYLIMIASLGYGLLYQFNYLTSVDVPNFWTGSGNSGYVQTGNIIDPLDTDISGDLDSGYVYEGTGKVIDTTTVLSGDNTSGSMKPNETETSETGNIGGNTGTTTEPDPIITKPGTTISGSSNTDTTSNKPTGTAPVSMIESLKYLFDSQKVSLSTKTSTSFDYIKSASPDYKYAQTAYEKRMIGKNSNLNQQISCETYMVFKGLLAGRKVGSYTDVKAAYRNKASELGETGNCTKGALLTADKL